MVVGKSQRFYSGVGIFYFYNWYYLSSTPSPRELCMWRAELILDSLTPDTPKLISDEPPVCARLEPPRLFRWRQKIVVKMEGRKPSQGISTANHRSAFGSHLDFFLIGKPPLVWESTSLALQVIKVRPPGYFTHISITTPVVPALKNYYI